MDEDLDDAAKRVLRDLTGLKNVDLMQFKAFGSKDRTKNPKDVHWLERAEKAKVERNRDHRLLCHGKNRQDLNKNLDEYKAEWVATGRSEGPGIRSQSDYCRSHEVYPATHRIQPVVHLRTASTEVYRPATAHAV